jgi:hypothetical protein
MVGSETQEHDAARPKHPLDLTSDDPRGIRSEVLQHVPAQHPVDARIGIREPETGVALLLLVDILLRGRSEIGQEILHEQLAAQLFAEKGHVRPDRRTQVDHDRRRPLSEGDKKAREGLGRKDRALA